jgi:hypothetical protein
MWGGLDWQKTGVLVQALSPGKKWPVFGPCVTIPKLFTYLHINSRRARVQGELAPWAELQAMLQGMLQAAGPVSYYYKVLTGRFAAVRFVASPLFWAFPSWILVSDILVSDILVSGIFASGILVSSVFVLGAAGIGSLESELIKKTALAR